MRRSGRDHRWVPRVPGESRVDVETTRMPLPLEPLPVPARLGHPFRRETAVVMSSPDLTHWREVRAFHDRCTEAIRARPERLVIDLTAVNHADSKLVASLVAVARLARAAGIPLVLQSSTVVMKWIDLCRVEPILG